MNAPVLADIALSPQTAIGHKLRHLHHIALQVAVALGANGTPLAPDFITRVLALDPTLRRVTGAAKISLEAISLWSSPASPAMVDMCKKRLRTPRTESDIAREVIAAYLCAKVEVLQRQAKIGQHQPLSKSPRLTGSG